MAQTIADIENEILTEKANHAELNALTPGESSVTIWELWIFIFATITMFFEQQWDAFKAVILNIVNNNQYGTDPWWMNKMLAYQYGDTLSYLNYIFQYAAVDTTKQIISFCSITSLNGIVQIKVAANINGVPTPLSTDQYNGALAYCKQVQPSGIRFALLSIAPDLLRFYGNIYYDPSGDITVIQPAVEAAITTFINSKNGNNFDGSLYVNKLIDAIQAVPNLVGNQVDVINIASQNSGGTYATFTSNAIPESGCFIIDPAYPLSATLTYIPYVAS